MTALRIAVHTVLRGGALALLLVAYDAIYDRVVTPVSGDADIGKGILAFLAIVCASFVWGLLDGLYTPALVWSVAWVLAGLGLGLGWELVLDDGSFADVEPGSVTFIAMLVLAPAIGGAGLTWALGGRTRTESPQVS